MEKQLGVELFHRAGRHISLTEAGRILLPMAREMVHHSTLIEETMASLAGDVVGQLMLGCSTSAGKYVFPHLVARFRQKYPNVKVSCIMATRRTVLGELLEGKTHLAVSSVRKYTNQIKYRFFLQDPVVLVVPVDHPWAARKQIEPEELLEGNFIFREEDSGTRVVLEEGLEKKGLAVDQLQTTMEIANSEAIRYRSRRRVLVWRSFLAWSLLPASIPASW